MKVLRLVFAFVFRSAFLTCAQPHDPPIMLKQSPSNPERPHEMSVIRRTAYFITDSRGVKAVNSGIFGSIRFILLCSFEAHQNCPQSPPTLPIFTPPHCRQFSLCLMPNVRTLPRQPTTPHRTVQRQATQFCAYLLRIPSCHTPRCQPFCRSRNARAISRSASRLAMDSRLS